jgi:RimJ/RimL family protein N-acetyltransferase
MSIDEKDFSNEIEDAKLKYNEYLKNQKYFQCPIAHINIDIESDETTKVHIEVQYKGTEYQFKSIEEKDINDIYQYLNSQPSVREKYGNGNTLSLQATTERINTFVQRFRDKNSPLYLYSGFVLYDSQTETFLGIANLGGGTEIGTAEMAFLNRPECWSHPHNSVSTNLKNIIEKTYSGIGTVETSTLLQYAHRLKQDGYQIKGQTLKSVVATARIDNEGSWKSCAKAGMILYDIDIIPYHGTKLRYQLRKNI